LTRTGLGRFVHELLAQQDRKLAPGTPDSRLKFAFYSGHDTTLVPLMHVRPELTSSFHFHSGFGRGCLEL
jgi:hypothetical protein